MICAPAGRIHQSSAGRCLLPKGIHDVLLSREVRTRTSWAIRMICVPAGRIHRDEGALLPVWTYSLRLKS